MSKPSIEVFCNEAETLFLPTILKIVRDKDIAAEIFQKTMLAIIEDYDNIEHPEAFGWKVIHILKLKNRRDFLRDKQYNSLSDIDQPRFELQASNLDTESVFLYQQYNLYLNKAIQALPDNLRELANDYISKGKKYVKKTNEYRGMTVDEFCEKYHIGKTLMHETISQLKKQMKRLMELPEETTKYEGRRRQK